MSTPENRAAKTLTRRLAYLERRRDELGSANSHDRAEIAALKVAIDRLRSGEEKS